MNDRTVLLHEKYSEISRKPINTENQRVCSFLLLEMFLLNQDHTGLKEEHEHKSTHDSNKDHYGSKSDDSGHFCHDKCYTEIDKEMDRILKSRNKELMNSMSSVLSQHFMDLHEVSPRMFEKLTTNLKMVK